MHALAVVVLMATVGAAEQSYGPYPRPSRGDAHSIAVARNRMLLAWSEVAPNTGRAAIRIGLLNSQGRLIGNIYTFPAARPTADATEPVVTSTGDGFVVMWKELDNQQTTRTLGVDMTGVPTGAPQTIETPPTPTPRARIQSGLTRLGCSFCGPFETHYFILWSDGGRSGTYDTGKERITTIGVTRSPEPLAVAWSVPLAVAFFVANRGAASIWAEPDTGVAPGIACDAVDCVIAYGTASGDVHGVTFPLAQPGSTSLFTIAASERRERAPQVHLIRDGRFFVAYHSDQPGDARLAGRIVTLDATKRRAMR